MYLKRLEIQGFKSLADKIELQLQPGVSAIVGPNGCGKSNISDAIRWVLGEQSIKNLRGAKMEDVIFAGSDKRKQVGMAEVSMTLDNSDSVFPLDFSEITITRRIYRSGESEFLINKSPCRLKDIHELFMDTGIGREGYSIISQGKIDEILSVKSEDRRQIIEEAAGIVKVKTRKQQAVKKLTDTEQNLIRINDIVSELENQVGPLEEQSMKAQEYLTYKNELVELEVNLLAHQITEQKGKVAEIEGQDDKVKLELIESETALRSIESQLEEEKFSLTLLDEEITSTQRDVYETGTSIEKKESEIKVSQERLKNNKEQIETLQRDINELNEKQANEKNRHFGEEEALKKIRGSIEASQEVLAGLEGELFETDRRLNNNLEKFENDKADVIDLLNEIANVKNSIHANETNLENSERRMEQLGIQMQNLLNELEAAQEQEDNANNRAKDITKLLDKIAQDEKDLINRKETTEKEIEGRTSLLTSTNKLMQEKSSRLKVLNDLKREHEGYYKGVREVLKANDNGKISGICGVVAEIIKVSPENEIAIEVSLGGAIQNIITETDIDARKSIEFLKRYNLGRATFLPINTIKGNREKNLAKYLNHEGYVGVASELVQSDAKYKNVIEHLLGRILVVKDIKCASDIARASGHSVKIVTLDGDVINPGGAMTGGSYNKNSSGLLSRNRETEELSFEIQKIGQDIQKIESDLTGKKAEFNKFLQDLSQLKAKTNELNIELASLAKEVEASVREKSKAESNYRMVKEEQDFVLTETGQIKSAIAELNLKLEELKNKDLEIKNSIEAQREALSSQEEEKAKIADQITGIKIELAKLNQEELNFANIMNRVMETINDLNNQIERKQKQIEELTAMTEVLNNDIAKSEQDVKLLSEQKGINEDRLNEARNKKQATAAFINEKETVLRQVSKNIDRLKEQVHSTDVKKARLEFEIESSITKLSEEYKCSYEEAMLRKTEEINKREITSKIKELKDSISAIGDVNLGSIEEYARVKERYEFLNKQYEDLEQAKASLYKVIGEMDEIMTQKFSRAFAEINESFTEVFTRLFGGGRAQLVLTDAENLLESGIEIIAQPPGKKNQHLSLLSGGEKALTAISLLLGILKNKPSPFCVLDEIEAALDEANVDRYASFIKEFSQSTQFIVITHRKGTMEVADALYGVTMDESRVTKLVSMKLSETVEKVS